MAADQELRCGNYHEFEKFKGYSEKSFLTVFSAKK